MKLEYIYTSYHSQRKGQFENRADAPAGPPGRSPATLKHQSMSRQLKRKVQPEILDSLPENHPEAVHNRRDLRLINFLMGNFRWFQRILPQHVRRGETGLELGAGDGSLGRRLFESGRLPDKVQVDGLDLWTRPDCWPERWRWRREDLLSFSSFDQYDFILGNFIFHQFTDEDLARLGARLRRRARVIVACETVRRTIHLRQIWLLRPLGINRVSWHDGRVSIRAGFLDEELPDRLGLSRETWDVQCHTSPLGAYRMIAVRR